MKGIVPSHREALARVTESGDLAIVKRGVPRSVVMRCPDGCGETITLNLDPRTDKAWRVYKTRKGLTLFPSVWRDTGCKSHFVLWDDILYWANWFDMKSDALEDEQLEERILGVLKPDALTGFIELADALGEIPWAVLDACNRLVRAKKAEEGPGSLRTSFRRLSPF